MLDDDGVSLQQQRRVECAVTTIRYGEPATRENPVSRFLNFARRCLAHGRANAAATVTVKAEDDAQQGE